MKSHFKQILEFMGVKVPEENKNLNDFISLVKAQFIYGGSKYALKGSESRESTDALFDDYGKNWLFGTCAKYVKRFRNVRREKDLLKIATYCYIIWLKRGFFILSTGITDPALDTNVKMKEEYFPTFCHKVSEFNYARINKLNEVGLLELAENNFKAFAKVEWKNLVEDDLFVIFWCMFRIWNKEFAEKGLAGKDQDINNESKK
jgi:hypothetical protein